MAVKSLSKSKQLAVKVLFAAFQALKERGGELPARAVLEEVAKRVLLNDWEVAVYEKTGYIRWQSILHFYSIDAVKAGFLVKQKGTWYLTPEGDAAISMGAQGLWEAAAKAYKEWKSNETTDPEPPEEPGSVTLDQLEQLAADGLKSHINSKNPYEFQDLAAALLRGMGYYTPLIAPRGKDGGVDIMAYRDPLGTVSPRIKVQVKHRIGAASVDELRQLMGILQKDVDVGIFISTGGFTSDAKTAARQSHIHVELIDLQRFIALWQEYYQRLVDEDKAKLPLYPIFFLAPPE